MLFGVQMFATHYAIRPDTLAREAEARGFESLWFPEHTHIPVSRRSPWPGGSALPREYSHTHDLFVALAMAAAATSRLKVASGICLLVERDPIITAKEVATRHQGDGGRARLFPQRVPGRKFGGLCLENDRRLRRHLRGDAAVDGKQANDPKKLRS